MAVIGYIFLGWDDLDCRCRSALELNLKGRGQV